MPDGPVLVLGAGGHAKVVIEALRAGGVAVAGVVDRQRSAPGVVGAPLIGADEDLPRLRREGLRLAIVAIGDNRLRVALGATLRGLGFGLINAISPSAEISPTAQLGEGVAVLPRSVINAEARVADFAIINTAAVVEHDCEVGEGAHIAPGAVLTGGVSVGARTLIGANACVTPMLRIGQDVTVGAGACVVAHVAADARVAGVPARPFGI